MKERKTTFLKIVDSLMNTSKRASKIVDSMKNTDSWKEERNMSTKFY